MTTVKKVRSGRPGRTFFHCPGGGGALSSHDRDRGLLYDQTTDGLLGLAFGMTDADNLTGHDIGFSYSQYKVEVRSPDDVWHTLAEGLGLDEQSLNVFDHEAFELVRITDPITGEVILEQDFTAAQPGDVYALTYVPEPGTLGLVGMGAVLLLRRRR